MSEYIKREDAINKLADEYVFDARSAYEGTFTRADFIDDAKETLADIPSADVVEVVRCKDCMWGNNKTRSGKRYCELSDMYQVDDGFCNWGEKIK